MSCDACSDVQIISGTKTAQVVDIIALSSIDSCKSSSTLSRCRLRMHYFIKIVVVAVVVAVVCCLFVADFTEH